MIAGAAIGAAVGGAAGKGVARAVNPAAEDGYWRGSYVNAPYYQSGRTYEDYEPAYRLGYYGWSRYGGAFDQSEDRLSNEWKSVKGQSRLTWNEAKAGYASRVGSSRAGHPGRLGSRRQVSSRSRVGRRSLAGTCGDGVRRLRTFVRALTK